MQARSCRLAPHLMVPVFPILLVISHATLGVKVVRGDGEIDSDHLKVFFQVLLVAATREYGWEVGKWPRK